MRFLVGAPLPPRLAAVLCEAGHDAVHARDLQMQHASDREILGAAAQQSRVVVTLDLDFAALLATYRADQPSVLILRVGNVTADEMIQAVMGAVATVGMQLRDGTIAVTDGKHVRVRRLPI